MEGQAVRLQDNNHWRLSPRAATLLSGMVAGLTSRTAVAPFERVIIIRQTSMSQYKGQTGTFEILRQMYKAEGVRGFLRGNWANCVRMAPNTAIEFFVYDWLKKTSMSFSNINQKARYMLSGSLAGVCAYSVTYPVDVVRTLHSLGTHTDKGIFKTLVHLVRKEGFMRLYKGLGVTCLVEMK